MLAIELDFLNGRYHATPWGRHVNEGVAEWPPSPYRLIRALVDAWKRRFSEWSEDRVTPLLAALAGPPEFWLPPVTRSHLRLFQHSNTEDAAGRQLIFDPFVALAPGSKVVICWPHASLDDHQRTDLNAIISQINYLGRSESWVQASLGSGVPDGQPGAFPAGPSPSSADSRRVKVACATLPGEYQRIPLKPVRRAEHRAGRQKVRSEIPLNWLEAVCLTSADILKDGWSGPPSLTWVEYELRERTGNQRRAGPAVRGFNAVLYALEATVRPRVTDTVAIAERTRAILMGIHRRLQGGDPEKVSWKFSGKDQGGAARTGHRHCFYLPMDEDGDGFIDHLLVTSREPFDDSELAALDRLRAVWQRAGRGDVAMVMTGLGTPEDFVRPSRTWVSATPLVPPRHHKNHEGPFKGWLLAQVRAECQHHGLPEPLEVVLIAPELAHSRGVRWFEFLRSRRGERARSGFGFRLVFAEPISGPIALGYGCHFGLGLFIPQN